MRPCDVFLGLDGGGTKTEAVIVDSGGAERGRGLSGPCNIATCDDGALRASVRDAMRAALQEAALPLETRFAAVCAGVAGYVDTRRRADFARLLAEVAPADHHWVEPDFVIAYWGATEGEPGIVVIAGTGAVVYGRNAAGEACRVDGRGFLLGDRGSGFQVGAHMLHRTLTRLDSGERPDDLDRRLLAHIEAEDADGLVEWVYRDFRPVRIAELASVVGSWAGSDKDARGIVEAAGAGLAQSAIQALQRLHMQPTEAAFYLLGGLWNIHQAVRAAFQRAMVGFARDTWRKRIPAHSLALRAPKHDPAYGAALMARQRAQRDDDMLHQ